MCPVVGIGSHPPTPICRYLEYSIRGKKLSAAFASTGCVT